MLPAILKFYLVLLFMNLGVKCEPKGSLTFVMDVTGSMFDDIEESIKASQKVLRMIIESNSSVVENFVLISFGDPEINTEIVTREPAEFSLALENLLPKVGGGDDCPEMSMSGIEAALEVSLPGSFLYVFTDASAKDFSHVERVNALAQKKQSRVSFLLTGTCDESRDSIDYLVYHQVAALSSGQVYHLEKNEVSMVLETVPALIIAKSTVLTSQLLPTGCNSLPFTVDSKTRDVTISASGQIIGLVKVSRAGVITYAETLLKTSEITIISIPSPLPGDYEFSFCSDTSTSVVVNGRTDFDFKHGFSFVKPKSLKDTTIQPIAGVPCRLAIDLMNPEKDIILRTVEILDINENLLFEVSVHPENKDFYISDLVMPAPEQTFKIAIKGIDKNGGFPIRRISKTAIEPIKTITEDYSDLSFTCGFSSNIPINFEETLPQPKTGVLSFLALNLFNPTNDVELKTAEILDINNTLLFQAPLGSKDNIFYTSVYDIMLPDHIFKVAVKGSNKFNGSPIRKINDTAIEPLNIRLMEIVEPDLNFTSGFLPAFSENLEEITLQPTAGPTPCHLAIDILNPTNDVELTTAEILDDNNTVLLKVPINKKIMDLYISDLVVLPDDAFKVAIRGVNTTNGSPIRKINETIIVPANETFIKDNKLDFNFTVGFSPNKPKSFEETVEEPTAGTPSYLAIDLNNPENDVELNTVEILDINDNVLFEVPLQSNNKDFYFSEVTSPEHKFKVAIKGVNKISGLPIRKISEPIKPKTEIKFKYGFTSRIPKSFDETAVETDAGMAGRLVIDLKNPDNNVYLKSIEVLDINDMVLFETNVHTLKKDLYISDPVVSPKQIFKVAVKGEDKNNGLPIRKISDTAVEPKGRPPKIDKTLTQLRLNPSKSHKLRCPLLEGYPEPVISWYYKVQGSTEYVKLKHVGKAIDIVANTKTDLYRCNADNEYGHDYKDIKIFVNFRPKFLAPKIGPKLDVALGESVTLPCEYRGQPKPTSKWQRNGKNITPGKHYVVQPDHSLRFTAEMSDTGKFSCVATNERGSSRSSKFTIKVIDPKLPKRVL